MTVLEKTCIAMTCLSLLFSLLLFLWYHLRMRRMLDCIRRMLDTAIDGTFTEHSFDESMLSSLESRFKQYLSTSAASTSRLSFEQDKIRELVADISHQTKTPIANILLYTQLLSEQSLPEQGKNCVNALNTQTEKLNFLVASLVKLSRLETGILTLHPTPHDIAPILEMAAEQFWPKAQEKNLTLLFSPTKAAAICDQKWTAEALCNLIDNAVKYTPAGGMIHVNTIRYNLFCRIDITDTGNGIPESEQAQIFTRFYRSPSVSETEGVGIGLYLTRKILMEQGGYIKVSSHPGEGTVFSVYLPCVPSN